MKVKGLRYACDCVRMSLLKTIFGRTKRIDICLLPKRCPEHNREIIWLIGSK